ncbi:MAG TPA: GNAT family N-acetyltransferase [Candidatus Sulfotelmatobacter sp.]|nr:GNAT family N-acetyltransferase [Candidatus Sulfotelmatobacter sp.]
MRHEIVHQFPSPEIEAAWRDLLTRAECPAHYDAPEYFLEPHWSGKRPFAVLAFDGNRLAAALTGVHQAGELISGLPSRPQIAVDRKMDVNAALTAILRGLFQESGAANLITVHSWSSLELEDFVAKGFRRRKLLGCVVLDLTRGAPALFQEFSKDRRRNIRFAEKHGIAVRQATNTEDFRRAYEVYVEWMNADHKGPRGEQRTFENFEAAQLLRGNRRLFLAELSGKVIAINMFRYYSGGLFESAANYSLNEFLHLKPNDLLQWKGIEWACSEGLRRHSLGGAHPFLTRFGGTIVPIMRYRLDRSLLRKHDLRELIEDTARKTLRRVPTPIQEGLRRALAKKH